jgi:uncharacterized protein YkwD
MELCKRFLGVLTTLVVCFSMLAATPAHAEGDPDAVRSEFVSRINDLRAAQGLSQLSVDPALTMIAQEWSQQMAAAGGISHRPNLADVAPSNWIRLGENVGVGPSVASLDAAFIASPHHYANLVDPAFQRVGIGIVFVGSTIYVTENFMTVASSGAVVAASAPAARSAAPSPARSGRKASTRKRSSRRTVARRH